MISIYFIQLNRNLKDQTDNVDFSELCITSKAEVVYKDSIETKVTTTKAKGSKCSTCWKIKEARCSRENCSMQ